MLALGLTCCPVMAQENKGEVISLLPDGVTLNIGSERKMDKQKNLVVVGSPKKGYKAFFAASDATHGEELWVTDGTKEGTRMVADIQAGEGSSSPAYLTRFNDKVVFSAVNDEGDREPWISDGTPEGTFQLADCYAVGNGDPKTRWCLLLLMTKAPSMIPITVCSTGYGLPMVRRMAHSVLPTRLNLTSTRKSKPTKTISMLV